MSHAHGKVKFEDGTVLCCEYDGTVDLTCTALRRTHEEVSKHWRAGNMAECTCGAAPEKVRIMTDYGGGFSWDGTACRMCMAITGGINPDDAEDTCEDGIPDWAYVNVDLPDGGSDSAETNKDAGGDCVSRLVVPLPWPDSDGWWWCLLPGRPLW